MNEFIRFNFLSIQNTPKDQKNKFEANVVKKNEIKRHVRSCEDVKSCDSGSLLPEAGARSPGPHRRVPGCPACPRHRLTRLPPCRPWLCKLVPRPPLGTSGATSSCRLPVSELGPTPFSAVSGTSLLWHSPLRATVCLCVRPSLSLSVRGGSGPHSTVIPVLSTRLRERPWGSLKLSAPSACSPPGLARLRGAGMVASVLGSPLGRPAGSPLLPLHTASLCTHWCPNLVWQRRWPYWVRPPHRPSLKAPCPDAVTSEGPGAGAGPRRELEGGHRAACATHPAPWRVESPFLRFLLVCC